MSVILNDMRVLSVHSLQPLFRTAHTTAGQTGGGICAATLRWVIDGECTSSISVTVNMDIEIMILRYKVNGQTVCQQYELYRMYSNMIPNTYHWQVICPRCGKVCNKLYLYDGVFVSRQAIPHAIYEIQTESHKQRRTRWRLLLKIETLMGNEYCKRGKWHYKGNETRRHIRWGRTFNRWAPRTAAAYGYDINKM